VRSRVRNSRRFVAVLAALLLAVAVPPPARAQNARQVALVIGNGNYQYWDQLHNAPNDAQLIGQTLQKLGFVLVGGKPQMNLDRPSFERALKDFGNQSAGADVAVFYYAGHGLQVNGSNYLVPTEANPSKPSDLELQMVSAALAISEMDDAKVRLKVMILDACRDNPYARKVGGTGRGGSLEGLARMKAPEGTIISFSTQPDNVAADGTGADSPYATALAATIPESGLDIFQMFNRVGVRVALDTNKVQQPWFDSSPIDGDFYFAGAAKSAAGSDAQSAALHVKAGNDFYNAHNLVDAAVEYHAAMAADPKDAESRFGLGLVYDDENNADAAIAQYKAAIALDPKYEYPHYNLGLIYKKREQYDAAIVEYKAAIALVPKDASAWNNIGNAYDALHNADAAIDAYKKAIAADPKMALPHNGLAGMYYDADKYDLAEAEYRAAIALNPSYHEAHTGLGNIFLVRKNYDDAVREYLTAIGINGSDAHAHSGLGYVYFALKNYDVAVAELRTAVSLEPGFTSAHAKLAATYRALGKTELAAAEDKLANPPSAR
jgi:tetratricopeptide (TPR) repeat protein